MLKLMWELYHGLVAVMLIQRLLDKFPSCASIGTSHAPPSKHLFVIYLFSFPEWKQLTFPIGKMRERERERIICFKIFAHLITVRFLYSSA